MAVDATTKREKKKFEQKTTQFYRAFINPKNGEGLVLLLLIFPLIRFFFPKSRPALCAELMRRVMMASPHLC